MIRLILCLVIPMAIGGASGYLSASGVSDWYTSIHKPSFNPPSWVFGPVWTLLYLLMGYSLYLVLNVVDSPEKTMAVRLFVLQISLNFFWSLIFFRWHQMGWAFVEILILWLAILGMIFYMYQVSKTAALLQIPYLLWVSFASILSGSLWWLNR